MVHTNTGMPADNVDAEFDRLMEESAGKPSEGNPFIDTGRINRDADHREMLALLRTMSSTLRGMSARDAKRASEAKELGAFQKAEKAARRKKAIQYVIILWTVTAGICAGCWIARAEALMDNSVVYFINAVVVAIAMYISGWLHGWSGK